MDPVSQFRIEEFKALRAEILYQIAEIDKIKFWVAAGMAIYYSFITTKFLVVESGRVSLTGPLLVWMAPILLPILGLLRLHAHVGQLQIFSDYIMEIEKLFPPLEGWEHFYNKHRSNDVVWTYDDLYFLALLLFSFAVLIIRWRSSGAQKTAVS